MKRYRPIRCTVNGIFYWKGMEEDENGEWLDMENCIICEQENMIIGDPLDEINKQIQKQIKNNGPFDVMIILKEKENNEQKS